MHWSGIIVDMCQMPYKLGNMWTWTWEMGACNMNNAYYVLVNHHHFCYIISSMLRTWRSTSSPGYRNEELFFFHFLFNVFFYWYGILCISPYVPWKPAIKHYYYYYYYIYIYIYIYILHYFLGKGNHKPTFSVTKENDYIRSNAKLPLFPCNLFDITHVEMFI